MSLAPDVELRTPVDDLDDLLWTEPTAMYNMGRGRGLGWVGVYLDFQSVRVMASECCQQETAILLTKSCQSSFSQHIKRTYLRVRWRVTDNS